MKQPNKKPQTNSEATVSMAVFAETVARAALASKLGMSYGGDRDLYQALGYKQKIGFSDYWMQYTRQDIAKAIIDRPVAVTWSGQLDVLQSSDTKVTQFESQWKDLCNKLSLKTKFSQLDKLTGIGRYGVLLFGLSDVKQTQDWMQPVKGKGLKLLYVRPLSENTAKINKYVSDPRDERFGLPELYDITLANSSTGASSTFVVHYTRVLHISEDNLEDTIYGTPRLQAVFNRLQDIEKLVGGSAEMFWRGARPGYEAAVDPEYTMPPDLKEDLKEQIDEFEHNLRRIIVNQGVKMTSLAQQVADPANHLDIQLQMISAETNIPKRILTGSERGELSSSQDSDQWHGFIQSRREEFAEPCIVRPFIERCMEYGILAKAAEYDVKWSDLFAPSEKETAEVGRIRAEALKAYTGSPGADMIVTPDAFLEYYCGFNPEQIELITKMRKEYIATEPPVTREEEDLLNEDEE